MLKPTFKIKTLERKSDYGRFVLEPLEQGYGHTLGNALRRVLLTSLEGAAITQVKIDGARHRFSTIKGIKEDAIELLLNLKEVRLKFTGKGKEKMTLDKKGPGKVTAADIKAPATIEIVNPKLKIATLSDKKTRLKMEMGVVHGFAYSLAEERKPKSLNIIPLDAGFTPVTRVNYRVETTRVGRRTDFDKLIMEIWTDATIKPKDALEKAAEFLVAYFDQIIHPVIVKQKKKDVREEKEALKLTVEELGLATRVANALRKGGFETVADLAHGSEEDIVKVKNLGDKSLDLIRKKLKNKGVKIGENSGASKKS